jgi:hypothetical protein
MATNLKGKGRAGKYEDQRQILAAEFLKERAFPMESFGINDDPPASQVWFIINSNIEKSPLSSFRKNPQSFDFEDFSAVTTRL